MDQGGCLIKTVWVCLSSLILLFDLCCQSLTLQSTVQVAMLDFLLAVVAFTLATVYKYRCQVISNGPAPRSSKSTFTSAAGRMQTPRRPMAMAMEGACDVPHVVDHMC